MLTISKTFDHGTMRAEVDWLAARFRSITDMTIEPASIPGLLRNLVEQQRPRLTRWIPEGSWCVVPDPAKNDFPSDAQFHYMDFPTLCAAGILATALIIDPTVAHAVSEARPALHKAITFIAGRNLHGHGFDRMATEMDWIQMLHDGSIIDYVADHPAECAELKATLVKRRGQFQHAIDTGNTMDDWNQDYRFDYLKAMLYLEVLG